MSSKREYLKNILASCDKIIAGVSQWIEEDGSERKPGTKDEILATATSLREQIRARLEDTSTE